MISLTMTLILNISSAYAVDPDASTKAAIEKIELQIASIGKQIEAANFPQDVCSLSNPTLVAAEAERNRLARDFPYQLFDKETGNTYTLEDLANKAGRPITLVTQEQMDAAIAAIESAKAPCNEYSRLSLIQQDLWNSLENLKVLGDGTNQNTTPCQDSIDYLNVELDMQKNEVNAFTKIWSNPDETINFVSRYSQDIKVSIEESYKILYKKSLLALNEAIKTISYYQTGVGTKENNRGASKSIQPLSVCETVRPYKGEYTRAKVSVSNFLGSTNKAIEEINLNYPNYEKLFTSNSVPTSALLKKVQKKLIICARGKSLKKISGTSPKCPAGFKKK